MAATFVDATDAILSKFRVKWLADTPALTGGAAPVIVYEQLEPDLKPHPRDGTEPWTRIVIRHGSAPKVSLTSDKGTAKYRRLGTVWVQVFCPAIGGKNWTLGQQLAMVAQSAYEGERAGSVVFTNVGINERPRDGAWLTFDVKGSFYWDEVK